MGDHSPASPRRARDGAAPAEDQAAIKLDLDSPEVRAAMAVLGIEKHELTETPRRASPLSPTAEKRRQELLEKKRQDLLAKIQEKVKMHGKGTTKDIGRDQTLMPARGTLETPRMSTPQGGALDDRVRILREQKKSELQKVLTAEQQRIKQIADVAAKKEEEDKRLEKLYADRQKEAEDLAKKLAVKAAHAHDNLAKDNKRRREAAKLTTEKLQANTEKCEQHHKEFVESWSDISKERHQKFETVLHRRHQLVTAAQQEMARSYKAKESRTIERLDAKRERERENAIAGDSKYKEKLETVATTLKTEQEKREKVFKESAEAVAEARGKVVAKHEEKSQALKSALAKRFGKKEEVMKHVRQDVYEKKKNIMQKVSKNNAEWKEQSLNEDVQRRAEQREVMDELVSQNKQRVEKANEYQREMLLARIKENQARVDDINGQRQTFLSRRTAVMKEYMIERHNLERDIRTMKPPTKETAAPTAEAS